MMKPFIMVYGSVPNVIVKIVAALVEKRIGNVQTFSHQTPEFFPGGQTVGQMFYPVDPVDGPKTGEVEIVKKVEIVIVVISDTLDARVQIEEICDEIEEIKKGGLDYEVFRFSPTSYRSATNESIHA